MAAGGAQFYTIGPILDSAGNLYPYIKIYHYAAGTTTAKDIWADEARTTPLPQPLIADEKGVAVFYADGVYKFVIQDKDGNTLYTWDNVKITADTATLWEGDIGTDYPASGNKGRLFAKVDATDRFQELGFDEGAQFEKIIHRRPSTVVDVRDYPTLADAITAAGNKDWEIQITRSETISADLTVPANVTLRFRKGNILTFAATTPAITVTFKGPIICGYWQIFKMADDNNPATVYLANGQPSIPQYWGAVTGDDQTKASSNQIAIRHAWNMIAQGGRTLPFEGILYFPAGRYITKGWGPGIDSRFNTLGRGGSIVGESAARSWIELASGENTPLLSLAGYQFWDGCIRDLTFCGNETSTASELVLVRGYNMGLYRLRIQKSGKDGLAVVRSNHVVLMSINSCFHKGNGIVICAPSVVSAIGLCSQYNQGAGIVISNEAETYGLTYENMFNNPPFSMRDTYLEQNTGGGIEVRGIGVKIDSFLSEGKEKIHLKKSDVTGEYASWNLIDTTGSSRHPNIEIDEGCANNQIILSRHYSPIKDNNPSLESDIINPKGPIHIPYTTYISEDYSGTPYITTYTNWYHSGQVIGGNATVQGKKGTVFNPALAWSNTANDYVHMYISCDVGWTYGTDYIQLEKAGAVLPTNTSLYIFSLMHISGGLECSISIADISGTGDYYDFYTKTWMPTGYKRLHLLAGGRLAYYAIPFKTDAVTGRIPKIIIKFMGQGTGIARLYYCQITNNPHSGLIHYIQNNLVGYGNRAFFIAETGNDRRPDPSIMPTGVTIWNETTKMDNVSYGMNWYRPDGTIESWPK